MEPLSNDQTLSITLAECPNYTCQLKLSDNASGTAKMTVLLFAIDFVKERTGLSKLENSEISMHFDEDNITTPEELLMTKMEQLLLKRSGPTNPFHDRLELFQNPEVD